jgi:16S rRNA (cytosine967-C5)-methyltransferase
VPPTAFRLVGGDQSRIRILDQLREAGAIVEPSEVAEGAWRVSGPAALVRELAAEGKIYLQDEASQLVAQTVDLKAGECALDLCAAPGGKTTLMAQRAEDRARSDDRAQAEDRVRSEDRALIIASDRSRKRLDTVLKITASHNLTSIKSLLLDATQPLPFADSVFDRILVDAPCSGTGTLRRNPEIRWRISNRDIHELAAQQKLFLKHAARVLKRGGQLVYSTCSVEREENEEVVRDFLQNTHRFEQLQTIRTWPHREGTDGFFIASFRLATQQ